MSTVQTVTLLMKDGTSKRLKIPNSLLQELVVKLGEGSEWVHTGKSSYEVVGVLAGKVKPTLIVTEEEESDKEDEINMQTRRDWF